MEIKEFPKCLLFPGSVISSPSITLLETTDKSTWIKGVNFSITNIYRTSYNNLFTLYILLELIPLTKMVQLNNIVEH